MEFMDFCLIKASQIDMKKCSKTRFEEAVAANTKKSVQGKPI